MTFDETRAVGAKLATLTKENVVPISSKDATAYYILVPTDKQRIIDQSNEIRRNKGDKSERIQSDH